MRDRQGSSAETGFQEALSQLAVERRGEDIFYAPASPSRRFGRSQRERRVLYSHLSEGIELAYVRRGAIFVLTPGQVFRLTPGKLLVVERGVEHAELPGHPRRGHRVYWCHLNQTGVHLADTRYSPSQGLTAPGLDLPGRADVERIGQAICSELSSRSYGHQRAVFALVTYLSCLMERRMRRGEAVPTYAAESPVPVGDHKAWSAIRSALEFCERNFGQGITRRDVARAVGYSPSHLGHLVSTYLGRSLSEYLVALRIAEGKRLLEETELTVAEIATSAGYADRAHFTRAFIRVTGLSPTAYRHQFGPL